MAFLPWYLPKSQPDRCRFKLGPRNNSSGLFFIDQKPDTLGAVVGRGVGSEHGSPKAAIGSTPGVTRRWLGTSWQNPVARLRRSGTEVSGLLAANQAMKPRGY